MRPSPLLALALVGACATDPQPPAAPADPGTTSAHVAWSFTLDGAPARCADVHVDTVTLTLDGPGVAQDCTTDTDEPFAVTTCYPRSYSYTCTSDGIDTQLELDQGYAVDLSIGLGNDFLDAREDATITPDAGIALAFELASIDLSWEVAPGDYDVIDVDYGRWGFSYPFEPVGSTRVLVPPGSELLDVSLYNAKTHASHTLLDTHLVVPRSGTSLALRPGAVDAGFDPSAR